MDPAFVNNVLGALPGVNPNDPRLQSSKKNEDPKKATDSPKKKK